MAGRVTQPQSGPVLLDYSNPLTDSIASVLVPSVGMVDLITGELWKYDYATAQPDYLSGAMIGVDSTANYGILRLQTDANLLSGPGLSHFCVMDYTAKSGGYAGLFGVASRDGTVSNLMLQDCGNSAWGIYPTSNFWDSSTTFSRTVVGIAGNDSSSSAYENGVLNFGNGPAVATSSLQTVVLFGERVQSTSYATKGRCYLSVVWRRRLTDAEAASFYDNPWQIFAAESLDILKPTVTPGGTHDSTGALAADVAAVAGSAARSRAHTSTGALTCGSATAAGLATRYRAHATSGALASGAAAAAAAAVIGSATRYRAHATTGAMASGSATASGAVARYRAHDTTGVLIADIASVSGSAARAGAPATHATTGALSSSAATVTGQASRPGAVTHDTTGALAAGSASTAGTARRYRSHAATGALGASDAAVSGTARRQSTHSASGALVAAASTVSGAASRASAPVSHATSGELISGSAQCSGVSSRNSSALSPGQFTLTVVRKTSFDCKIQRKVIFTLGVANRVR